MVNKNTSFLFLCVVSFILFFVPFIPHSNFPSTNSKGYLWKRKTKQKASLQFFIYFINLMKPILYFCEHKDCQVCTETTDKGFKYIETVKGEKFNFERVDTYTVIFILAGEALISCNEYTDVLFKEDQIALWPMNSSCSWESITDTASIVLIGDNDLGPCDKKILREDADLWINTIPEFNGLQIKPRLKDFLYSVKNYLDDKITCPYIHKYKQREFSMILRAYYSPEEIRRFFLPTVRATHEFEHFVMENYLKMKGVKEFVDLSGMNLHTFNRKFKAHFKESPYQWLIKQKSKHIYHALVSTDKNLTAIAKEFHFADASHFNRFCKSILGASPSRIREEAFGKKTRNGG